ncbi:MAG: DUF3570 domain-containing protein [Gammaproteobacteria bacterium]|nr:DUF3570 domain-containing protein [Gammaproteobacteria bacterium]
MKKISSKKVRDSLTLACCSLLHSAPEARAELLKDVQVDSAVLVYSESDGRVSLIEPVIKLKSELDEDEFLNVQLVLDTLTGASPNGAQISTVAQTFTSPSGNNNYTIQPGDIPLDDTFHDTRVAISASLEKPLDRLRKNTYSAAFSTEYDFLSFSAGYTYTQDSQFKDTTYMAGASLTSDTIGPVGGAPIPFAAMQPSGTASKLGDDSRSTIDLITGITKVLNKKTITQLNYSYSRSNGYHNDPYKVVSIVDGSTGLPTYNFNVNGDYLYESRPDSRQRHIVYWKTAHHLTEDVINVAYRYYQDDWGISSHTVDFKYRYELANQNFLQPHIRFYSQTGADFYRHSLTDTEALALPEYASADLRLAEFTAFTVGLKYSHQLGPKEIISGRVEIMQQTGDSSPVDAIGVQTTQDLHPDLTATILQLSYSFIW